MSQNLICKWRKKPGTGRHTFHFEGKRYSLAPGDEVVCPARAFGSIVAKYTKISTLPNQVLEPGDIVEQDKRKNLVIVKVSRWKYNIINPDNPEKPLNDEPVKIAVAKAMLGNLKEVDLFENMDWGDLVKYMEKEEIEVLDDYESEADLRKAIAQHNEEAE